MKWGEQNRFFTAFLRQVPNAKFNRKTTDYQFMGGAFQPVANHAKIRVKAEVVGQRAKGLRRGRGHRFFFSLTAPNQIVKSLNEKEGK